MEFEEYHKQGVFMLARRLSLLLPGLMCSAFAYAGEGFYVGGGVGYSHASYEYTSDFFSFGQTRAHIADFSPEENTFVGEVSAGYQWLFLNQRWIFSFALEAFADFKSTEFENSFFFDQTDSNYIATSRAGNIYGISLKPGIFLLNDLLLYGDIGVAYTQIEDITSDFNNISDFTSSKGSFADQDLWGLRVGAGIQWLLTKQLSLDLSWATDIYSQNVTTKRVLREDYSGPFEEQIKITDFTDHIFLFGFNYYFDIP